MRLPRSPLPCVALLTLLAAPPLAADDAANHEGAAKYRHHTMQAIGGHMQALVDILRRDVTYTDHLPVHAGALAALAEITPTLFPPGSGGRDTEALPAIWENPEDFAKRVDAFREAAANLNDVVGKGGALGPAVKRMGQACKGCHDEYRAE